MPEFRWLHLSDCHVGGRDDQSSWPSVRDLLKDDLSRLAQTIGPIDVVIFTGDMTFRGSAQEFQRFEDEFLTAVWDAIGSDAVLLAIPGNHDLIRPSPTNATASGLVANAKARDGLFRGDADSLGFVNARFAAYTDWWTKNKRRPLDRLRHGVLPGDFTYVHEKNGLSVGFVGFNSTWLQLFEDMSERSLDLDIRQITPACGDLHTWTKQHRVNFLLTHQPVGWLTEEAQKNFAEFIAPPGRFIAHLFGHMHESRVESTRRGGGHIKWTCQAPSLFGLEKVEVVTAANVRTVIDRRYGYIAGHLDVSTGASITLWPRRGVKAQDQTWRIASDWSFHLENDFANVPAESVTLNHPAAPAPAPAGKAASSADWMTGAESGELWTVLQRSAQHADCVELLRKLIVACSDAWKSALAIAPDPWGDYEWAPRTLARVNDYLRGQTRDLSPEAAILLTAAPFLRNAVLASGIARLMEARPFDFKPEDSPDPLRRRIEREHAAHEILLERAAEADENSRHAIVLRIVHLAVRRWPALWRGEAGLLAQPIVDAVQALEERLFPDHEGSRFIALARATASGVGQISRSDDGLRTVNIEGNALVMNDLASLLSVAGQAALDLGQADPTCVEHLGLDREFALSDLVEAVRTATWVRDGRRHVLNCRCKSQVVDFSLREFIDSADAVLAKIASEYVKTDRPRILMGLPERFSADGVVPVSATGPHSYRLPHIRFQLDHVRIRDLLMGQRLYGDPGLALRELYQNALDACRYRRARQECAARLDHYHGKPYQGRITFREGVSAEGRQYIECSDNGVGMTEEVLERVFAIAGRRFHDSTEYTEERTQWEQLGIAQTFVPNSQFGIGVLSYFMLADELEIETRPFTRDAKLGSPLNTRISSAAGLFRLRSGRLDGAGTTVRLYLGPRARGIDCRTVMSNLLWVAEFETVIESHDGSTTTWVPGKPGPVGSGRDTMLLEAEAGVAWWSAERKAPILVDGIATEQTHDLLLLNYTGKHYPRLSVDRKQILNLDLGFAKDVIESTYARLVDWEYISLHVLEGLEERVPALARVVETRIAEQKRGLRLDAKSEQLSPTHLIGFFSSDRLFSQNSVDPRQLSAQRNRSVLRWRLRQLAALGLIPNVDRKLFGDQGYRELASVPPPQIATFCGDSQLIKLVLSMASHDGEQFSLPVFAAAVLHVVCGFSAQQLRERIELFATARVLPRITLRSATVLPSLDRIAVRVLSVGLNGDWPYLDEIRPHHIMRAAAVLTKPVAELCEMVQPLRGLGIPVPEVVEDPLGLSRDARIKVLLSRDLDGHAPWLAKPLSQGEIGRRGQRLKLSYDESLREHRKLAAFGVEIMDVRSETPSLGDSPIDRFLRDAEPIQTDRPFPAVLAVTIAAGRDISVDELVEMRAELESRGIHIDSDIRETVSKLRSDQFLLKAQTYMWGGLYHRSSSQSSVMTSVVRYAYDMRLDIRELVELLADHHILRKDMSHALLSLLPATLDAIDARLVDLLDEGKALGEMAGLSKKAWLDYARFLLWEIPEETLTERIERWAPIFFPMA